MASDRAESTRDILIAATATRLTTFDESELRIADICTDTGFSSSVIYTNFGSRQGLIDAAFLLMYDERARLYAEVLAEHTATGDSLSSLLSFYGVEEGEAPIAATLKDFRRIRLRVATAALARPHLREAFVPVQEAHLERMAQIIEGVRSRGLLGRRLTGRQLAILLEGFSFGRAVDDISPHPEPAAAWLEMIMLILEDL